MAHITPGILDDGQQLSVTLDRYQELMSTRVCMCSFNGITKEDDANCCDCNSLWKQSYLDTLAVCLARAEEMREREIGYHIAPKYIDDEEYDDVLWPIILKRKHLIAIGSQKCDDVSLGEAIELKTLGVINDPVTITIATALTNASEIKVYYHDEDIEITPSSVKISGGNLIIKIPRCRLLSLEVDTNCDHPMYDEDSNFVTSVDVKRCYTDYSDGMFKVWTHGECCDSTSAISEVTELQYPRISDKRLAIVKYEPASYDSSTGEWTRLGSTAKLCRAEFIRVSYLSGRISSVQTEMETIQLAHTLAPDSFADAADMCSGCWQYDREEGDLSTPYGDTRGAIAAWLSDSRAKVGFSTIPVGFR